MPVLPFETVDDAVARWNDKPEVEYAEADYIGSITFTPNDPNFSAQYGMTKIAAPDAWSIGTGSPSVSVCVIDTGVDYNHPDLAGNVQQGYNAITNTPGALDDNGHGTHISGIIAGLGNNGLGVAGLNWQVTIQPCKFLSASGTGLVSDAVECVNWCAANGYTLASHSWSTTSYMQSLYDAMASASAAGQLVVTSAGNSGISNDNSTTSVAYPASFNLPNQIAVAATDGSDLLASWSNWGLATVPLAAPGVNIISTVLSAGYSYLSGTSQACPHVSGTAALIYSLYPTLTVSQVKSAILGGVDVLPNLNGYVGTGGRLNAYTAIQIASGSITVSPPPPAPSLTLSHQQEKR